MGTETTVTNACTHMHKAAVSPVLLYRAFSSRMHPYGLTSFFSSLLHSLFYLYPLPSSHSAFHYCIHWALCKCKQGLVSFYACTRVAIQRGWELWPRGKSGQSPIVIIIVCYNGRHPLKWTTLIGTLMIVSKSSSCVCVRWSLQDLWSISQRARVRAVNAVYMCCCMWFCMSFVMWVCKCAHTPITHLYVYVCVPLQARISAIALLIWCGSTAGGLVVSVWPNGLWSLPVRVTHSVGWTPFPHLPIRQ